MTHQIFHQDETVKGYKNIGIDIFYSPATLVPYLNWNYEVRA
jgi:hypothetical protein